MQARIDLVYERENAQRLDKYLADLQLPELYSRTFIDKLIEDEKIAVNGKTAKKSCLLHNGDKVQIDIPPLPPQEIQPFDLPLSVIYEDEYLAVINKPANLVVHPGFGNPDNTLANALVHRYGQKLSTRYGNLRPGIVHRLDKGTSGLIIVALNDAVHAKLADLFSGRKVKKTYLAVTSGIPETEEGTIETHLARSHSNPRQISVSASGRNAVTNYKVLHYYNFFALLAVKPETGRTHQIRAHLAYLHCPVLGDPLYNSMRQVKNLLPDNLKKKAVELLSNHLQRQALHAWKLNFTHPYTGEELNFTAPLPEDIIYTLNWLDSYFAIDNVHLDKKMLGID
ncbi:MAG TPA: RluA family pseudouridine synthase [Candidatus Cloacimonadota bacterium]|nr:RluA family pseudouridine synthase [Candidatus Cloacimonadota bacterium]